MHFFGRGSIILNAEAVAQTKFYLFNTESYWGSFNNDWLGLDFGFECWGGHQHQNGNSPAHFSAKQISAAIAWNICIYLLWIYRMVIWITLPGSTSDSFSIITRIARHLSIWFYFWQFVLLLILGRLSFSPFLPGISMFCV